MSAPIKIELTGKSSETWNRVFTNLTKIIDKAVTNMMPNFEPETREATAQAARDIALIAKDWVKAKLESPTLDNEKKIAEIAALFEEIKLKESERRRVDAETDLKRLEFDQVRFRYWVERITTAMRLLCLFETHCIRGEDGSVTLLLTNENLIELTHALRGENTESDNWQ